MIHLFRMRYEAVVFLACFALFGICIASAQAEQATHPETVSESRTSEPDASLKASPPGTSSADLSRLALPARWWDDKKVIKHLGLRPEQKKKMNDIFNANKNDITAHYQLLVQEQAGLEQMSHQPQPEEAIIFAQIDRVSQVRASLQKADAHLLLLLRQELDPSQLKRQKDYQ